MPETEYLSPANGCVAFIVFRSEDGVYHLFPAKTLDTEAEGEVIMRTHRVSPECRCEPIEYYGVQCVEIPQIEHMWVHCRWNIALVGKHNGRP